MTFYITHIPAYFIEAMGISVDIAYIRSTGGVRNPYLHDTYIHWKVLSRICIVYTLC